MRIAVVNGLGVNVDRDLFERWCGRWSGELGVDVRPCFVDEVAAASVGDADGLVVNPGPGGATLEFVRSQRLPTVWVDLAAAERPLPPALDDAATMVIRGRGVWSYRWAVAHLLQRLAYPYETIAYGETRDHVADLRLPESGDGPFPVAVFFHGGFWRERWERDTIEPLAVDLARRGYATWNLEYRRVGPLGGGWPATCVDVAAGLRHLATIAGERRLDLERVVFVGHSAGGHLALWSVNATGAGGQPVRPALVVALASVSDLVEAARRGLGDSANATADFIGARPDDAPEAYAQASPAEQLPLGVPQLVVQGNADAPDFVDLNRLYAAAARRAGDDVEHLELEGADHFDVIDPASAAWARIVQRIEERVPPSGTAPDATSPLTRTA